MTSALAQEADFSIIRYAQCWEDADVLLEALDIQPDEVCLSIASGGDNTLSLLTRRPRKVIAVDLSPAQMACLEIRMAAYRDLSHPELLELMGARASDRRDALYARLRPRLSVAARTLWDARTDAIALGIGGAGKFETYMRLFRHYVLPLIHGRRRLETLFQERSPEDRKRFYERRWDGWRWRLLVRMFCSQAVSEKLGRDPRFFRYAEGDVAAQVLASARRALVQLDPSRNPYLHWIAFGDYGDDLPHALRPENFDPIRENLDRLDLKTGAVEDLLAELPADSIARFNMSDVFEYMSAEDAARLLREIVRVGRPQGRVVYWNTFVPRSRPAALADRLRPLSTLSARLHQLDKVFFYRALVVEEIV